uniref:RING-type domain-containing protein n=2 Tax=Leptocylindrus danicus TaxID=163516 RepID=A0A7S2K0W5_9STRA|mmetsp:Transcript_15628/g.23098  ORF Transcript_15628/g.23098 Transcript_15628/m.23098 type:complete len:482 (+) Transcript_15628:240-1685(+)|eukprot:CAMPEP_0116007622 /NCGR_PEP_ID=MMETSP0321-20121206/2401_1 /TAXON_ID=163516 /ORGANISM="Leptocylindrus danicus var. danicus, Strain B650" /LENGTH=481 /DNA_ID=CAMNT_0003476337 /DNA_START=156 /DNA_END=1601 /DNA_ORIENTATION=+
MMKHSHFHLPLALYLAAALIFIFKTANAQTTASKTTSDLRRIIIRAPIPNPKLERDICHAGEQGIICDPHNILVDTANIKADEIDSFESMVYGALSDVELKSCESGENPVNVEVGIALVRRMDMSRYLRDPKYEDEDEESIADIAAQQFATETHDSWGIGHAECHTGIMLFISVDDRAIYISTGAGLKRLLTHSRLGKVMEGMKRYLRQGNYAMAIRNALVQMRTYIDEGEPTATEKMTVFLEEYGLLLIIVLGFGSLYLVGLRQERRQREEYAIVHSHLTQIERDRAAALQGEYQCSSCAICLEDFTQQNEDGMWTLGSDGLPLKLLQCGHVFDETCWQNWARSGQGDPTKCPVCRADVGGVAATAEAGTADLRHRNAPGDLRVPHRRFDENMYRREMGFRLLRLSQRYPRYVRPNMLQRWSQESYNGSLVQDRTFQNADPSRVKIPNGRSGNGHSFGRSASIGSSFGGGRSSGGRGGRW